jgi:hypothetical protein
MFPFLLWRTLRIRSKTGGKRSLPAGLSAESAGCEALCASRPADDIRSVVVGREAARLQRRAEWLGNYNRKTMIKIKNYRSNTAFQKRHGFAQSISSALFASATVDRIYSALPEKPRFSRRLLQPFVRTCPRSFVTGSLMIHLLAALGLIP